MRQGLLVAFLFLLPAMILSGFATPIANMSPSIQRLTPPNPLRYYLVMLRRVFLEGASTSSLSVELRVMPAIGAMTVAAAICLFRRRVI